MKSQGHTVALVLLLFASVRSQTTDNLPDTSSEVEDATTPAVIDVPATSTSHPECGPNEEWRTCATCNRTCADPRPICTDECKPAQCQCIEGYVLALNGTCIDEDECPASHTTTEGYVATSEGSAKCSEHEEYRTCATCNRTCENPRPVCTEECKPAQCQCIQGYVLASNGTCIDEDACPASQATTEGVRASTEGSAKCGENEEYRTCATCNRTCADPHPVCTKDCKPEQCQCIEGYVRAKNGTCIPEGECSKQRCGANEEFIYCPGCEPTCEDPYPMCPKRPCILDEKNRGCQCASGYVRNPKGRCVLPADCRKWRCNPPCPEGYKCELKQVWCIRAPCPPQPTCIRTFPWWWIPHWFP